MGGFCEPAQREGIICQPRGGPTHVTTPNLTVQTSGIPRCIGIKQLDGGGPSSRARARTTPVLTGACPLLPQVVLLHGGEREVGCTTVPIRSEPNGIAPQPPGSSRGKGTPSKVVGGLKLFVGIGVLK